MFGDKGVLDFVKRTPLFAVPYRAGTGIERKSNEAWTRECDMGQAEPGVPVCTVLEEKLLMLDVLFGLNLSMAFHPVSHFMGKETCKKVTCPLSHF